MLPLSDHNPRRITPIVNYLLIAVNVLFFFWELSLGPDLERALFAVAFIPARFWSSPYIGLNLIRLLVSMFLHGGWLHLGGNMLYLWIFGDNLEKVMGHARFLMFYLACGIAAGLAHIFFSGASNVPTVGASGAISGVLGGYLVLFPRNHVRVLMRGGIVAMPAIAVLGFWIVIQLVNGIGSLAVTTESGGVAYMAHIGGFVAGAVLVKLLASRRYAPA